MKKLWIVISLVTLMLSGCATIVGDNTQLIKVSSEPSDANISVRDETNNEIFTGKTPATITLDKSDGSYWGKKHYVLTLSKAGYVQQSVQISAHANGWYIAGNLVFGGFIGWFVVDPFNGKMYTLSPDVVNSTLKSDKKLTSTFKDNDGLRIILAKDVPESLRGQMQPVL